MTAFQTHGAVPDRHLPWPSLWSRLTSRLGPFIPGRPIGKSPIVKQSGADIRARLPGLARILDMVIIAGFGLIAFHGLAPAHASIPLAAWLEIFIAALLGANLQSACGAYQFKKLQHADGQLLRVSCAWAGTVLALVGLQTIYSDGYLAPPLWSLAWMLGVWLALLLSRVVIRLQIAQWQAQGRFVSRVAVIGNGPPAFDLARRIRTSGDNNLHVVGTFVDTSCPLRGSGSIADLYHLAMAQHVDEILIALPWEPSHELNAAVRKLSMLPVDMKIFAGAPGFVARGLEFSNGCPALSIQHRPLTGWGTPLKRAEDIVLVSLLIILFAPALLLIGLAVKLDSRGPVFFRQERFGFNNDSFTVFKFRTMRHESVDDPKVPQVRRNDPRITRVGGFLRRTSLDELPQLFNVLLGDMSLVGPRPHASAHNKKYARLLDGYLGRHRMKPGITGWAQIRGHRGETDTVDKMRLRLEHDLFYIDNWSFFLDLKIITLTLPELIRGRNAY